MSSCEALRAVGGGELGALLRICILHEKRKKTLRGHLYFIIMTRFGYRMSQKIFCPRLIGWSNSQDFSPIKSLEYSGK